jgi:hypothetical protein
MRVTGDPVKSINYPWMDDYNGYSRPIDGAKWYYPDQFSRSYPGLNMYVGCTLSGNAYCAKYMWSRKDNEGIWR